MNAQEARELSAEANEKLFQRSNKDAEKDLQAILIRIKHEASGGEPAMTWTTHSRYHLNAVLIVKEKLRELGYTIDDGGSEWARTFLICWDGES